MHEFSRLQLGDIADIQIGKTPPRDEPTFWADDGAEGFAWATIADMKSRILHDTAERISPKARRDAGVRLVPKGTLLMSFKLTIGRVAFAGDDIYTNEAIAAFYLKDDRVDSEYLYYVLPGVAQNAIADTAIKG